MTTLFAAVRESVPGPKRQFLCRNLRPKSGVKPTCQDSSTDAFDVVDGARSRQRAPIG